jgi:hypothetical protein
VPSAAAVTSPINLPPSNIDTLLFASAAENVAENLAVIWLSLKAHQLCAW